MSTKIVSLNEQLPELFVEELETRLETDPLLVGGLLQTPGSDPSEGGVMPLCVENICGDQFCLIV